MKQSNKFLFLILSLVLFWFSGCSSKLFDSAHKDKNEPLRVFVIGNSFSANATKYLPQIAESAGKKLEIGRAELGGCSLERHWNHAKAAEADPGSAEGRPYHGKSLKALLSEGKWDFVVIQQYSLISSNVATYQPFATNLYKYVKSIQPDAEVVMHQTWAYRGDDTQFGQLENGKIGSSEDEMYFKSRAAYRHTARQLGVRVIPVGDAFRALSQDAEFKFKKDMSFNYAKPVYPELPDQKNSLHVGYFWNNNKKLEFDSHHAGVAGEYLGGLTWYTFLFNESPEKVAFKPAQVSEPFASRMKSVTYRVVKMGAREDKKRK